MTTGGNKWVLTQPVFAKLLAHLDADAERAGEKYEQIRRAIVKYFESRGCAWSHELADETINRVARKISEGTEIQETSLSGYFYGVARNVFREYLRDPALNATPVESLPRGQHPASSSYEASLRASEQADVERHLECLESCVEKLPAGTRGLIISYYECDKGSKVEYRRKLAETSGLSPNSLRIRVHRIREKLEKCVEECAAPQPRE